MGTGINKKLVGGQDLPNFEDLPPGFPRGGDPNAWN